MQRNNHDVMDTIPFSKECTGAFFHGQCAVKGDTVTFGKYPQASNTPDPIKWLVIEVVPSSEDAEGRLLLLSKYVLDVKPYHTSYTMITWEKCSLRKWLNDGFMKTAFDRSEKKRILKTHLENADKPFYHSWGG